ncbi:MAG TPA: nucleotide sugar dehydrogenase [Candidatus Limnocylindrales bacterium]|nr:nucleotide sugar dehydrogenase [Candidatus Limnocylindrales bacterium]
MRVTVVGLGAVGLVTAACLAAEGHDIVGLEADPDRLAALRRGEVPFHEPGLDELTATSLAERRLVLSDSPDAAVSTARLVILAVGTHGPDGSWQSASMVRCLLEVVPLVADDAVLVIRSTLPPDFAVGIAARVAGLRRATGRPDVPVLLNPEFTREGTAVHDFQHPSRIVIGIASDPSGSGLAAVKRLYAHTTAPLRVVSAMDACLGKLAANLFLGTRISFANELAAVCEEYGADIEAVVDTMAPDPRIGSYFFRAGLGFGGSCLPSQVAMMSRAVREHGLSTPLLDAVTAINARQIERFADRLTAFLGDLAGARICLLGLAFKPGTDDLRDAPSLNLARRLIAAGAAVVAYDPMPRARSGAAAQVAGLQVADSAAQAIAGADAIGLVTEWAEFAALDWEGLQASLARPIIIDGRNALDAGRLIGAGYAYAGFGRADRAVPAGVADKAGTVGHDSKVEPVLALAMGRVE